MDLERDERLVEGRALVHPVLIAALAVAVLVLEVLGLTPVSVLLGAALLALGGVAAVWSTEHIAVTDRRIIVYRVLLARAARRFPRLAPLEAHRRLSIPLAEIMSIRRSATTLVLRTRTGERELQCHGEEEAARLLSTIDGQLRKAPWLRPKRELPPPKVTVTRAAPDAGRCPYCHDEVAPDEAATCEQCGVVQHEECTEVHGGCAAFGCAASPRRRERA